MKQEKSTSKDQSKIYVVGTPIGNLADISIRAIQTLFSSNVIVCEDTRRTGNLLKQLEVRVEEWGLGLQRIPEQKYLSYRDQIHVKAAQEVIAAIDSGAKVALVSDSGMPAISDPGFKLINELLTNGYSVETVPGPTSVATSLVKSGLPTDKYVFLGFLPRKKQAVQNMLQEYGALDATLVIFESPFRVMTTLVAIEKALGNRQVAVAAELTKMHERVYRGEVTELLKLKQIKLKGEFVILVTKESYTS